MAKSWRFLLGMLVLAAFLAFFAGRETFITAEDEEKTNQTGKEKTKPAKKDDEKPPAEEETPPAADEDETIPESEIAACKEAVQKTRELEFKADVNVGMQDRETLRKKMEEDFATEMPPERMEEIQKTLVKFCLVPKDFPLEKFMIDLMTEQIGGFYDPESKELYVVKRQEEEEDAGPEAAAMKMLGVTNRKIVLVHELTHAMQDQHFDLLTMPRSDPDMEDHNDDTVSAVQALFEGEATYVMYAWMYSKMRVNIDDVPDIAKMMEDGAKEEMEKKVGNLMSKAPVFIRESLMFPYVQGFKFFLELKKNGGWEAVTGAYSDLPASTEQILSPKKFFGELRDYPTLVNLPELKPLLGEEWKELDYNVVGQFVIDILLREFFKPSKSLRNVAKGWDGDSYRIFDNKEAGKVLVVWYSTWDEERDSKQFFEKYCELIPKKYKDTESVKTEETLKTWKSPEGLMSVELRGKDVLVVESAPTAELLDKMAETVWKETTKSEMKEVNRMPPPKKKEKKEEK